MTELKIGDPCGHPGCLSHVTHPCEGCGRIARAEADAEFARSTAETLRNTLTGIALDVSVFKDSGKIIVLARCQGGDLCKIIDIPQGLTLKDQLRMCSELSERFGVRPMPAWVDAPWSHRDFIEQEMERIWEKP